MKQRIFASIVLAMLTLLASCEKETLLNIDQTTLSFTDVGGSQTISLTANKPWTASSNQSWCKISPSAGEDAASSRITITCDANTTYDSRNCSVSFTCAEKTATVNVGQATNNGLLVSQTSYELTKSAQQINIQVQANVKFSVEVDNGCKDWVKYNTTKGLTTSTVVLDIAENKTYDSREGKVTIKQEGGNLSSTITIKQSQLDGLFITTPEYDLSNESHTLTVEVSTNVEFEVIPEADWVKHVQTKSLNTRQIILEVAENDTYNQREAKVSVKQKNGVLCGTITIKQDEKHGIMVTQSEYSLSNEAQTIEAEVKFNVDYNVVIPEDCKNWIKLVSTKSLDSKTYTFSVAKNETYDNREGSITFKQKDGVLCGTIVIKQSQTDGLIAEKKEYVIASESQVLDIQVRSNIKYDVIIDESCKDWISRIGTKGLVEETLSFQIAHNSEEQRQGRIILRSSTVQEEIIIVQETRGYVEFDDEIFEAFCLHAFDNNKDCKISYCEAEKVGDVSCINCKIKSLKGIEHFVNISSLSCFGNQLTRLDVSSNTALNYLNCSNNQLTSLEVKNCVALKDLDCHNNRLSSLDVRNNMALEYLDCSKNQLTRLDISSNTALEYLDCHNNRLSSLDVRNNMALEYLDCSYNYQLTSLDVRNNTALEDMNCSYNQLTSLDVGSCTYLQSLYCNNNQLTSLDVRNNKALEYLKCSYNQLSSLDISSNTALKYLKCSYNQLSSLDVSSNTALFKLYCENNQLTRLDVSSNTALFELYCENNQLTSLEVKNCVDLKWLFCFNNRLSSLDVSNNKVLEYLRCSNNQITSLDVSNNPFLSSLYCEGNPFLKEIWLKNGQSINLFCDKSVIIKYK